MWLGLIPTRDAEARALERARLIAAGVLAVVALIAFALIMTLPPRVDISPTALNAARLAEFATDVPACRAALAASGFASAPVPDVDGPGRCGYSNAVELTRSAHALSEPMVSTCALAAGLALWERDVVDAAAERHLHQRVARIELAGETYTCRPIAGRRDRRLSEHAFANAVDIRGFTLDDGRVITVAQGWRGRRAERAFLRAVRDGACRHFQAVLSPDYNRAHRDHLHFDLGRDKMCR